MSALILEVLDQNNCILLCIDIFNFSFVYNASNNELVRIQTLVKSAIVQVDAAPFKQWYLTHYYAVDIGWKKKAPAAKNDAPEVCFLATESLLTLSCVRNWLHCSHTLSCFTVIGRNWLPAHGSSL